MLDSLAPNPRAQDRKLANPDRRIAREDRSPADDEWKSRYEAANASRESDGGGDSTGEGVPFAVPPRRFPAAAAAGVAPELDPALGGIVLSLDP